MTDPLITIAFVILAAILVASALGVVLLGRIVHSALSLAVSFVAVAVLYILLNAEFLAAVQILIYAGAIIILILFAIMLTQQSQTPQGNPPNSQFGLAVATSLAVLGSIVLVLTQTKWKTGPVSITGSNTEIIGQALFNQYVLPFEIASIVLLVAMIGAIIVARED